MLAWKTTDATDISIDGIGTVNAYGTQNVTPTDSTTYHLVARGPGGSTDATARLTVNAAAPPPVAGRDHDRADVRAECEAGLFRLRQL